MSLQRKIKVFFIIRRVGDLPQGLVHWVLQCSWKRQLLGWSRQQARGPSHEGNRGGDMETGQRSTTSSKRELTGRTEKYEQQRENFGGKYGKAVRNKDDLKDIWGAHRMFSKETVSRVGGFG